MRYYEAFIIFPEPVLLISQNNASIVWIPRTSEGILNTLTDNDSWADEIKMYKNYICFNLKKATAIYLVYHIKIMWS